MRLAAWLATLLLLVGCGGGSEVSWCIGSGSGGVSAGYNTSQCPPESPAKNSTSAASF